MKVDTKHKQVYMIRHRSDGLYSGGGSNPKFSTNGKAWSNIAHLKNHLNIFKPNYYSKTRKEIDYILENDVDIFEPYRDCEIVVLSFVIEKDKELTISLDPARYAVQRGVEERIARLNQKTG